MLEILPTRFLHRLAGAALVCVVGCAQQGETPSTPEQPTSLRDVEIPEDFTFATSRGVALTVSADEASLGAPTAALEVARADGRVLYRGPLAAGRPLTLNLAVPTKDDALELKVSAHGAEKVATVAIADAQASHTF